MPRLQAEQMTVTINDPYAVGLKVHKTDDGSVVIVRGGHSPLILSVTEAGKLAAFIRNEARLRRYAMAPQDAPAGGAT